MNQPQLSALIGSPSPTAQALLGQIHAEEQQALAQQRAAILAENERSAQARTQLIQDATQRAHEILVQYDHHAAQITQWLIALQHLAQSLPPGAHPETVFPPHLAKVNVPPSRLPKDAPLHPLFSSVEAALMGAQRERT